MFQYQNKYAAIRNVQAGPTEEINHPNIHS